MYGFDIDRSATRSPRTFAFAPKRVIPGPPKWRSRDQKGVEKGKGSAQTRGPVARASFSDAPSFSQRDVIRSCEIRSTMLHTGCESVSDVWRSLRGDQHGVDDVDHTVPTLNVGLDDRRVVDLHRTLGIDLDLATLNRLC